MIRIDIDIVIEIQIKSWYYHIIDIEYFQTSTSGIFGLSFGIYWVTSTQLFKFPIPKTSIYTLTHNDNVHHDLSLFTMFIVPRSNLKVLARLSLRQFRDAACVDAFESPFLGHSNGDRYLHSLFGVRECLLVG